MTPEQSEKLREKFPPEAIGQKPQPYTKDSPKGFCKECGQKHGLPAMHLDFVGHALVTDRLLKVDPEWTWEPMGFDERGVPALDGAGNLWIRLTVGGVTRPGVGDGPDAKQKISDALRNAAMRFGVALDLWSKQELETPAADPQEPVQPVTVAAAKKVAWQALKTKHPTSSDEDLTVIALDALRSLGHANAKEADAEAWNVLAEEWTA